VKTLVVLLSCEHGGNRVPPAYTALFAGPRAQTALNSHRGYDPGALQLARALARHLKLPLHAENTTRLLVESNRSLGHPSLFSEFSAVLSADERRELIAQHYLPHRHELTQAIALHQPATVVHIAVHSFTPVFKGVRRRADIAFLYDSSRSLERALCTRWQKIVAEIAPDLCVRRNYPYLGKADGLTTALRRQFPAESYLGIELETNQALLTGAASLRRRSTATLVASLQALLREGVGGLRV
jgi:predicted N-formylglutamate amidohydrolase